MPLTQTFVETRFPVNISYGSMGGSGFNTTIFETTSGYEQRNVNWSKSRGKWDVSHAIKTKSDMDEVVAFFMAMQGRALSFRFKDWADFQIANQLLAPGDGVTTDFQLIKVYSDPQGKVKYTRTINKPDATTLLTVTINGVPVPVTSVTLNASNGIFSFIVPPAVGAAIIVQYVEFDVPVRFDTDELNIKQDFFQVETWDGIKLIEVRLS